MYASASALMKSAREKAEKYPDSQMNILSGNNRSCFFRLADAHETELK